LINHKIDASCNFRSGSKNTNVFFGYVVGNVIIIVDQNKAEGLIVGRQIIKPWVN